MQSPWRKKTITNTENHWPGACLKHRMKDNGIKMYDKYGSVLRIETVINRPYYFKVRRHGRRNGQLVICWFPMAKGIASLYRYAEASLAANSRYLDALATVDDPAKVNRRLNHLGPCIECNGRSYRGFNPVDKFDPKLILSELRKEDSIMGFRSRDIRPKLFAHSEDSLKCRRQS